MALRRTLLACSALALVLGLAGCAAEKGDPCKEDNDCSGGLMCCKSTFSASARGTCLPSCEMGDQDAGPVDSGPGDAGPEDAGPTDAAADAPADAATDAAADAGSDAAADAAADAGADAGPEDAGADV